MNVEDRSLGNKTTHEYVTYLAAKNSTDKVTIEYFFANKTRQM